MREYVVDFNGWVRCHFGQEHICVDVVHEALDVVGIGCCAANYIVDFRRQVGNAFVERHALLCTLLGLLILGLP